MTKTTPQQLLDSIYRERQVRDATGAAYPLHSEVTVDEGELIRSIIDKHGATRTLEIGCAYGLSSLHILSALMGRSGVFHTIIDPGQYTEWQGIGIHHIDQCGFSAYELITDFSEFALPDLLRQQRTFDFILIDGWHTFDHVLLDFFFANRLLEQGGVMVLDDLQLPAIRKVARYVSNYPHYRVVGTARQSVFPPSARQKAVNAVLRNVARVMPASYVATTFEPALFTTDHQLGLTSEMVAFQKTGPDTRGSHWFRPF